MFTALKLAPNDAATMTAAQSWRSDIAAGLTTATMLVPQSMAYALLAGLDPIYGLYASTVPLFIYAFFGTSRQLAIGPGAMLSILTCSAISTVGKNVQLTPEYSILIAIQLMFLVGCFEVLFGLVKLGSLVEKLPRSVIAGFTYAAAILIMTSQMKHLVRIHLPRGSFFKTWAALYSHLAESHWPTIWLALFCVIALVILKKINKMLPRQLIVLAVVTLAVPWLDLHLGGVEIVGEVPQSLPWPPKLPVFSWQLLPSLIPFAITMSLVSFMEAYSGASNFAKLDGSTILPDREFISLGLANLAGSLFQGFPITGGLARTAVNAGAGAKTARASIITASMVLLTLVFLTGLFHYLPKAALSSVIVVAVVQLLNFKEARGLIEKSHFSSFLLIATFVVTLTFGIDKGLIVGVVCSVIGMIAKFELGEVIDESAGIQQNEMAVAGVTEKDSHSNTE